MDIASKGSHDKLLCCARTVAKDHHEDPHVGIRRDAQQELTAKHILGQKNSEKS